MQNRSCVLMCGMAKKHIQKITHAPNTYMNETAVDTPHRSSAAKAE